MWPPELCWGDTRQAILCLGGREPGSWVPRRNCPPTFNNKRTRGRDQNFNILGKNHNNFARISMKKEGQSPHLKEKDFLCEVFRNTTVLVMSGSPGGIVTTLLHANWIECKWRRWRWTKIETHLSVLNYSRQQKGKPSKKFWLNFGALSNFRYNELLLLIFYSLDTHLKGHSLFSAYKNYS